MLNEIAYIYRNQDCVFNICSSNLAGDSNQAASRSPKHGTASSTNLHNVSPKLLLDHVAPNMNVNGKIQTSENMKIIKTNLNYMDLNSSTSDIAMPRTNSMLIERESNLILNKQTNDIYFNRVVKF